MPRSTHAARLVLALIATALPVACREPPASPPESTGEAERFVAHGGGAIDGAVVTNSLEALDEAATRGYRLVEVDLSWTSDGRLVLLHDWEASAGHLGTAGPVTAAEFLGVPLPDGRTPLDQDLALDWLQRHPSVSLVTDVKTRNVEALRRIAADRADLRARIVPQVHDTAEAEAVGELGFDRIILTLYASRLDDAAVLEYAAAARPFAVTLPWRRALAGDLPARLDALGIRSYAHTVNDFLRTAALRDRGLFGVYTDLLHPDAAERERELARLESWDVTRLNPRPIGRAIDPWLPCSAASGIHPALHVTSGAREGTVRYAVAGVESEFDLSPNRETSTDLSRAFASEIDSARPAVPLSVNLPEKFECHVVWSVTGRPEVRRRLVTETQDVYEATGPLDGYSILGLDLAAVDEAASAHVKFFVNERFVDERRVELPPHESRSVTFPLARGARGTGRLTIEGKGIAVRSYCAPATLATLIDHW